jgi:ABC-2 type transport system ATP-binding protein
LADTQGHSARRIDALIEQVGLNDAQHRAVGGYSTGMRQRLGLVGALLNDPQLVVLDEPLNGLDPAGVHELRTLIRGLVDRERKTVFFSSHMLHEVELICDQVAIIQQGCIVREGRVAELLEQRALVRVEAEPLDLAAALLREQWSVTIQRSELLVSAERAAIPESVRHLTAKEVQIYQVRSVQQRLEEVFIAATRPCSSPPTCCPMWC